MNHSSSITGAWRVARLEFLSESGSQVIEPALPGLFIFTEKQYSMTWMPRIEQQANYKQVWHPTDVEKIESYNSIITNAGSYELVDAELTTHVEVAKTPAFIGGRATYRCEFSGDNLSLEITDNVAHDGTRDVAYLDFKTIIYLTRIK